jgi:NAD(P)-dependent dehydrogenase (short-subunit alcohol dehydrogenase family)
MTDELDPRHDRVVAVTGAGTGIGQAIATRFGALGWRVAIGGRRADKLAETAASVEEAGGRCLPHPLDVTDGDSVEQFFASVEARFGSSSRAPGSGSRRCGAERPSAPTSRPARWRTAARSTPTCSGSA